MLDHYSRADRICAGGAALTAIAAFLPWFHSAEGAATITVNGFRSGLGGDVVFLASAGMMLLLLIRHGVVRTGLSNDLPEGQIFLGSAVVAVLATLVQITMGSGGSHTPAKGLLIGMIGIAVMAAGGWMQYIDDASPAHAIRTRLSRGIRR